FQLDDDGVRVHRIRSTVQRAGGLFSELSRPHAPPAPDPEALRGLRRVIEFERPDVIHAHNWLVHSLTPLKRRIGFPLVMSVHDYSLVCANKRLMRREQVCEGP